MNSTKTQESKTIHNDENPSSLIKLFDPKRYREQQVALNSLKKDISMCLKSVSILVDDPTRTPEAGLRVAKRLEALLDRFSKCNVRISEKLTQDIVKAIEYLKAEKKFSKNDGTEIKSESEMNWDVLVNAKGALTSLAHRLQISK